MGEMASRGTKNSDWELVWSERIEQTRDYGLWECDEVSDRGTAVHSADTGLIRER
jgi:hypothetical protein